MKGLSRAALGLGVAGALAPLAAEVRVARAARPPTDRWRRVPVAPRGATLLGISFRPRQVEALGLDARATFQALLAYPFDLVRLGAYWDRVEPAPGAFRPDELDWQVEAAERAGKRIILCVGAVKTFGYPEFFVPAHHLPRPLREGHLVEPAAHRPLLAAATAFVARVVARYRDREAVVAWQVEHEAVDPLGLEHSWRLAADFVRAEVAAVRAADPARPVVLNGYLPASLPVLLQQWWRTRDQGDSLAVAERLADIVGVDYYPRHALAGAGPWTLYLDGGRSPWPRRRARDLLARARADGRRVMVTEGQAEPWETATVPPAPPDRAMASCPPERVIENYNQCLAWAGPGRLYAYLLWGAEYWVLRRQQGDGRYLGAFARVLADA
ncbi:MAG TPA: beta-galactosidase [Thermomicrobiales bacterium]|nr:beta-galactosidase [Thermomicrobiales bacterium]